MNNADLKLICQQLAQLHRELREDLRRRLQAIGALDAASGFEISESDLEARARLRNDPLCVSMLEDIDRVNDALERAKTGHLGVCLGCGEEIELNRLRADPAIAYCVRCIQRMQQQVLHS